MVFEVVDVTAPVVSDKRFQETERLWNLVLAARRARLKAYETELEALEDFANHMRGVEKL